MKIIVPFFGIAAMLTFSISAIAQNSTSTNAPGMSGCCGQQILKQSSNGGMSPQNGTGLANYYSLAKCGLNYESESQVLGQRFTPTGVLQPAPFTFSSIPSSPCVTIEKAILYCDASGNGVAVTATINGPLGTANYPMTIAGSGPDKCWGSLGYAGTYSYRADITASVNGNGTYNVSGLPTGFPNDVDGATIIVIWSDGSQSWQGNIQLDDGCIEISGGNTSYNMNYPAICGAPTNGQAFFDVADIQANPNSWTANSTACAITWDWWNYVTTPSVFTAGQTTSNYTVSTAGDCYNLLMVGAYYQTTCTTCTSNSSFTLASTTTNANCSACDGTATANPTPAGAYTYLWSPSGQTTQTATSLCAGTYTCTVTATCGSSTVAVTVSSAGNLTTTSTQNNISCNGGTGDATVTPAGGLGPYTYSWAPIGGTNATATGLTAGTFTCTVVDANGCTTTQTVTITQPSVLSVAMLQVNELCNGQSTGSATSTVSGGTPGYIYAWTPTGGNAAVASNLAAGNYSLTVTDANGCVTIQPVTITQPPAIANSFTIVNGCALNSGSATANVSGGTGPYTYSWSNSATTATDNNLAPGNYTLTVTDANGCTFVDSATILASSVITSTQTVSNVSCFGAGNGSGTVTPAGGTSPYTYSWSPTGGTNATATSLSPGIYTVTITDANGCQSTATITITEPPQLTSTSTSTNVLCNGQSTGSGTITPAGGTSPYTYSWSPSGGTNATATSLTAATFTVTATDANGCVTTQTITITQPSPLTVATVGDSVCLGSTTQISATGNGGVGPYTYSWSNGPTTQVDNINITTSSTFTVTVTDSHGCSTTGSTTVSVNPLPVATITSNAIDGIYTIVPNQQLCFMAGGAGVSAWNWILQPGLSSLQDPCVAITAADTGTYCAELIVENIHGCSDTAQTCLEVVDVSYSIPNVFTPNGDGTNDIFTITNTGMKTLHCVIYDRWGMLINEWDTPSGGWDGKTKGGKDAVDGVYYWTADLTDYTGKEYNDHGFVHLIRGTK